MGIYKQWVLPPLIDRTMRNTVLAPYRERLAQKAEGRVVEVGIGSGLNLPLYGANVREVIGIEPSAALLDIARSEVKHGTVPVTLLLGQAEALPLDDNCAETVVSAWTLCSVGDLSRALQEIRRVLKPGGCLVFVEHGLAPEPGVVRWQDRLNPVWRRIAGGCNLNRNIRAHIEDAGFRVDQLQTGYLSSGFRPWTFMYEGSAVCP
ncbi:MAG: class I SAM-dependent methyltransferase [Hyphomicrobiales bacterium]|nr:class I SAM-dependent methyltransferase [Hyphomicrobiales bacterium]